MRFLILAFLFTACSSTPKAETVAPPPAASPAAAEVAPPANPLVAKYTLEQLSQASNYLQAKVESDPMKKSAKKAPRILKCDPSTENALRWSSGQMRALLDEKLQAESAAYAKNPGNYTRKIAHCAETCDCSTYAMLLDTMGMTLVEVPEHVKNGVTLKRELPRGSVKQSLKCAKAATWFCGSDLEAFLKKEG